jgi:hypothetical protein
MNKSLFESLNILILLTTSSPPSRSEYVFSIKTRGKSEKEPENTRRQETEVFTPSHTHPLKV